jgi:enterobactin synthetase component D
MNAARRLEYIGGRLAAKRALSQAGCGRLVVEADEQGVPVFPTGYLGSIGHKHGRAVAAVARTEIARGVGIDLEFDENHAEESLRAEVVTSAELPTLAAVSAAHPALLSPATLMLAAAVYKAAFPLSVRRSTSTRLSWPSTQRTGRSVHSASPAARGSPFGGCFAPHALMPR